MFFPTQKDSCPSLCKECKKTSWQLPVCPPILGGLKFQLLLLRQLGTSALFSVTVTELVTLPISTQDRRNQKAFKWSLSMPCDIQGKIRKRSPRAIMVSHRSFLEPHLSTRIQDSSNSTCSPQDFYFCRISLLELWEGFVLNLCPRTLSSHPWPSE